MYRDAASRLANRRALEQEINAITRRHTVADLVQRLNPAGVPSGPVYDIGQAFEDPQARHLRMTRPAHHAALGDLPLIRSPINLSACPHPEQFHHAAPDAGEHTDVVLQELGYDRDSVQHLHATGAVA
jgi:crotonobetainyl-CoA:carnitine CoA-transferase CaiB-like acyl-CoA transferase